MALLLLGINHTTASIALREKVAFPPERVEQALAQLHDLGVTYPCFCSRKDIQAEIAAADGAPHGPDGPLYPGTCRGRSAREAADLMAEGRSYALRLDVDRARAITGPLSFTDLDRGTVTAEPEHHGDVVLARKDAPTSYHLAVTLDDALQGVTLVTRGADLFPATHIHRLLQALLDLPVPVWRHHGLLTDDSGKRFAKRDRSLTIQSLREAGYTPDDVRAMARTENVLAVPDK